MLTAGGDDDSTTVTTSQLIDDLAATRRTYSPAVVVPPRPAPPPWRSWYAACDRRSPSADLPAGGRARCVSTSVSGSSPPTRAADDGAVSLRARRTSSPASEGPWPSKALFHGTVAERTRQTVHAHSILVKMFLCLKNNYKHVFLCFSLFWNVFIFFLKINIYVKSVHAIHAKH